MTAKIRLVIADDHMLLRKGLLALIETTPDIEVIGEATDGLEAVAKTCELRPDVLLLDLMMPRMDGITAIGAIKRQLPDAKILVLTSFDDDDKVFPAFKAGALGYMLKDSAPNDLLQAIRSVHEGKSFLHPTIALKVLNELNRPAEQSPAADPLTERELEVLTLVAKGLANLDIAEKLCITEHTVGKHVSNILIKLHLANRTQVALYALRKGLVHLDDTSQLDDSQ
jgi:two-component system, NarL family, response regulator LiaR